MQVHRSVLTGVAAGLLTACAVAPSEHASATAEAVVSDGLHTTIVRLRSPTSPGEKYDPVVLSRGKNGAWSAAFHLRCSDCRSALDAFGYGAELIFDWAPKYETVDELRGGEQLPDDVEIVDLGGESNAIVSAFRVVDADASAVDQRYFVRLAANPKKIYAVSCDNFLNVFQGNTETIPVNKAVLEAWGKTFDTTKEISCNSTKGRAFPAPAAAPAVSHPERTGVAVAVWNVKYALPNAKSDQLPYLVMREADGFRSYAIDCGSESINALHALGFSPNDVQAHTNDDEFQATRPAEQPILRCARSATAPISAYRATNEAPSGVRFKMDDKPFFVEFGCDKARDYWAERSVTVTDVPAQALPYVGLNAAHSDPISVRQTTRSLQVGCKVIVDWKPWFTDAFGRPARADEESVLNSEYFPMCGDNEPCWRSVLDALVRSTELEETIGRSVRTAKAAKGLDDGVMYSEDYDFFFTQLTQNPGWVTYTAGVSQSIKYWVQIATVPSRSEILRSYDDVFGCNMSVESFGSCPGPDSLKAQIFEMYTEWDKAFDYKVLAQKHEAYLKSCVKNPGDGSCNEDLANVICRGAENKASPTWAKPGECNDWWKRTFTDFMKGSDSGQGEAYRVHLSKMRPNAKTVACIADAWPKWETTHRRLDPNDLKCCVERTLPWDS